MQCAKLSFVEMAKKRSLELNTHTQLLGPMAKETIICQQLNSRFFFSAYRLPPYLLFALFHSFFERCSYFNSWFSIRDESVCVYKCFDCLFI